MVSRFQTLRGFKDVLPGESERWQIIESRARELFRRYGFREIRTPHLEPTELFVRAVGAETDIVGKEMFTFAAGEESISLRPELTASVCRAYVEHGLDRQGLTRLYYWGPAFRRERPQKGRLRQFHQAGVEVFGESAPETDAEIIALGLDLVRAAGVGDCTLLLNSIGDGQCRPAYRAALVDALRGLAPQLCDDCQRRIERNPLRVLDCRRDACQHALVAAPSISDHLCDDCRGHFADVRASLERLGLPYRLAPRLVRGLDYYVRTTFEVRAGGLGSQDAVLGGGRYDGLVSALGGGRTPGLGWAAGIERLLLASREAGLGAAAPLDVFVVTLGDAARDAVLPLIQGLRRRGIAALWDPIGHGLGGQLRRADRSGARFAVLIGEDELARGAVAVKDLTAGEQTDGPGDPDRLAEFLRTRGAGRAAGRNDRHDG